MDPLLIQLGMEKDKLRIENMVLKNQIESLDFEIQTLKEEIKLLQVLLEELKFLRKN